MEASATSDALERGRALMLPDAAERAAGADVDGGYLDLLPADLPSTGPTQDLRRQVTLPPLKPVVELASGVRLFESEEIVAALQERGYGEIHQRLTGMVQFVGARLAG